MGVKDFFKPTVLKVIISIFLFIIIFSMIWWQLKQIYEPFQNVSSLSFIINLIISAIIGYLIGSVIDYFIKSNTIKIIIAVILAIFALIIGLSALTTRGMVCDPVHPISDGNTTPPIVCDPVHQP